MGRRGDPGSAGDTARRRRRWVLVIVVVAFGVSALMLHRGLVDGSVRRHETVQLVETLAAEEGWQAVSDTSQTPGPLPLSLAAIGDHPLRRTIVYRTDQQAADAGPRIEHAVFGTDGWPQVPDDVGADGRHREPLPDLVARGVEWRQLGSLQAAGRARDRGQIVDYDPSVADSIIGYGFQVPGVQRGLGRLDAVRIEVVDGAVVVTVRGGGPPRDRQPRIGSVEPPNWSRNGAEEGDTVESEQ